jgi:hypothetical protein
VIGCDDARNKIALYVDRELGGSKALEFEAHLTDCASCRLAYEDSLAVIDGVRAASPLYEVPEHSYAAIEQLAASLAATGGRRPCSRCDPRSMAAAIAMEKTWDTGAIGVLRRRGASAVRAGSVPARYRVARAAGGCRLAGKTSALSYAAELSCS